MYYLSRDASVYILHIFIAFIKIHSAINDVVCVKDIRQGWVTSVTKKRKGLVL